MPEKPKYHYSDVVRFRSGGEIKEGTIVIINACGIVEDVQEVSYDIAGLDDAMFFKQVKEGEVIEKTGSGLPAWVKAGGLFQEASQMITDDFMKDWVRGEEWRTPNQMGESAGIIQTEKEDLRFRRITLDDVQFMIRLTTDPAVIRFLPPMIADEEMMVSWIESLRPDEKEYIVCLNGEPVGECSLSGNGNDTEVGFMLLPDYWGKGYGTQIVRWLVCQAEKDGITLLSAVTDSRNLAARRVLEKNGFTEKRSGWLTMLSFESEELGEGQDIVLYERRGKGEEP